MLDRAIPVVWSFDLFERLLKVLDVVLCLADGVVLAVPLVYDAGRCGAVGRLDCFYDGECLDKARLLSGECAASLFEFFVELDAVCHGTPYVCAALLPRVVLVLQVVFHEAKLLSSKARHCDTCLSVSGNLR